MRLPALCVGCPSGSTKPIVGSTAGSSSRRLILQKHIVGYAKHLNRRNNVMVTSAMVSDQASSNNGASDVPEPIVKIDNESDPFATIVTVEYGDRLGELLDTIQSLRNLGLNIRRATLTGGGGEHMFYITNARNSEKVIKSAKLEEIRLTIINNMLQYHPESGEQLAWGSPMAQRGTTLRDIDPTRPLGSNPRSVNTQIEVKEHENGRFTVLSLATLDRPGLLTEIVHVLKDINLNVVSAEVDTIGRLAVDRFNVTYHGEPLPEPMKQLAVNALQYYLAQGEVEKNWSESY